MHPGRVSYWPLLGLPQPWVLQTKRFLMFVDNFLDFILVFTSPMIWNICLYGGVFGALDNVRYVWLFLEFPGKNVREAEIYCCGFGRFLNTDNVPRQWSLWILAELKSNFHRSLLFFTFRRKAWNFHESGRTWKPGRVLASSRVGSYNTSLFGNRLTSGLWGTSICDWSLSLLSGFVKSGPRPSHSL